MARPHVTLNERHHRAEDELELELRVAQHEVAEHCPVKPLMSGHCTCIHCQ